RLYVSIYGAAGDVCPYCHPDAATLGDRAFDCLAGRHYLSDGLALWPNLPRRNPDVRQETEPAGNPEVDQVRINETGKIEGVHPSTQTEIKSESASATRSFSFGERIKLSLISWAGFLLIRSICPTLRYEVITEPGCLGGANGPTDLSIWCFWHRS